MIKITTEERKYLVENGVKVGENGVSKTHSTHRKTYYLCESTNNLWLLNDYRDSITVKKYENS